MTIPVKIQKLMKPIRNRNIILDDEEIKTYQDYMQVPTKMQQNSALDYHSYLESHPDDYYQGSKWTDFTEPLLFDSDYH